MKTILIITFFTIYFSDCNAQSKHGFPVGQDTLMSINYVKTKTKYEIFYDSIINDTTMKIIYSYDQYGYLKRIEYDNFLWRKKKYIRFPNEYVAFTYNEKGYLINEEVHRSYSTGSYGPDSVYRYKTEKWVGINDLYLLLESYEVFNENDTLKWSDLCKNSYRENGQILKTECFSNNLININERNLNTKTRVYNECDLLMEEITFFDNKIYYVESYEYVFYDD
jgi:hypothetical protein